jgi:hypothetical protein
MNQLDDIPGAMRSVASAGGSPRGIGVSLSNDTGGEARTNRTATRFAWLLCALSVLLVIGYFPLRYQSKTTVPAAIEDVLVHASYLIYSTLGALIVSRARERRIGWLYCAIGLAFASNEFTGNYALYTLLVAPGSLPAGLAAAWFQHWIWVVAFALLLVFLPLLYPNGRLSSRRWKAVGSFAVCLFAAGTLLDAFAPGPLGNYLNDAKTSIPNPLGIATLGTVAEVVQVAGLPLLLLLALASATSLILRLCRATGNERQQLKWFVYVAALLIALFVAKFLLPALLPLQTASIEEVFNVVAPLVFAVLPLATGLAILKYRLYDIDLIINRTLVYGTLTILLTGVYIGLVIGLSGLLRGFIRQDNSVAIVLSTLAIAALFQPLREALQRLIDRRFYRRKYDAAKTLAAFSATLRQEVDLDQLREHVLAVVQETMQPASLTLWIRPVKQRAAGGEPTDAGRSDSR